ncbi:MAG: histidine phosphatase family protein [Pseudomonadota bacterium]
MLGVGDKPLAQRVKLRAPLYFVRHGQTDWNAERRMQGLSDIPLNDVGRGQARRNGEALADALGDAADQARFFTSPLSRARETCEILRATVGLPLQRYSLDDRLVEIDMGDWNGKTRDEIERDAPGEWEARGAHLRYAQAPNGERPEDVAARTAAFLADWAEATRSPLVVVGHGASGRFLRAILRGLGERRLVRLEARQDRVYRLVGRRETAL